MQHKEVDTLLHMVSYSQRAHETCANCDKAQLGTEQHTSVLLFEMVIFVIFVVCHYPVHMTLGHKLGRCAENQNGNLRWHLPLGVRPPPLNGKISRHFFTPLFFFCN